MIKAQEKWTTLLPTEIQDHGGLINFHFIVRWLCVNSPVMIDSNASFLFVSFGHICSTVVPHT